MGRDQTPVETKLAICDGDPVHRSCVGGDELEELERGMALDSTVIQEWQWEEEQFWDLRVTPFWLGGRLPQLGCIGRDGIKMLHSKGVE